MVKRKFEKNNKNCFLGEIKEKINRLTIPDIEQELYL